RRVQPDRGGRRGRHGSRGARQRRRGAQRRRAARRTVQCGRTAPVGLRRPVRPRRGDRAGRGNEGEHADTEVPSRGTGGAGGMSGLRVLAVDDEPPALDELAYLLRADPRVASVQTAGDVTGALRLLRDSDVDAVFLDIRMPGLDGMELARVLTRFAKPPAVVFVTAYDERAVEAFELGVVDYVRKPVQADRLAESLRRILATRLVPAPAATGTDTGAGREQPDPE